MSVKSVLGPIKQNPEKFFKGVNRRYKNSRINTFSHEIDFSYETLRRSLAGVTDSESADLEAAIYHARFCSLYNFKPDNAAINVCKSFYVFERRKFGPDENSIFRRALDFLTKQLRDKDASIKDKRFLNLVETLKPSQWSKYVRELSLVVKDSQHDDTIWKLGHQGLPIYRLSLESSVSKERLSLENLGEEPPEVSQVSFQRTLGYNITGANNKVYSLQGHKLVGIRPGFKSQAKDMFKGQYVKRRLTPPFKDKKIGIIPYKIIVYKHTATSKDKKTEDIFAKARTFIDHVSGSAIQGRLGIATGHTPEGPAAFKGSLLLRLFDEIEQSGTTEDVSSLVEDFFTVKLGLTSETIKSRKHAEKILTFVVSPQWYKINSFIGSTIEAKERKKTIQEIANVTSTDIQNYYKSNIFPKKDIGRFEASKSLVDVALTSLAYVFATGKVLTEKHKERGAEIVKPLSKPSVSSSKPRPLEVKYSLKSKGKTQKVKSKAEDPDRSETSPDLLKIKNLVNKKLHDQIRGNMGTPALNYRTGRFARSAFVERMTRSKNGMLSVFYDYMKYPYQTFEPGFKQGSRARDPKKLISKSIREIIREHHGNEMKVRSIRL